MPAVKQARVNGLDQHFPADEAVAVVSPIGVEVEDDMAAAKRDENAITVKPWLLTLILALVAFAGGIIVQAAKTENTVAAMREKQMKTDEQIEAYRTRVEILTNKMIALEANNKAIETLNRMEERQEKMFQMMERRR